jgi:hypothetical protein
MLISYYNHNSINSNGILKEYSGNNIKYEAKIYVCFTLNSKQIKEKQIVDAPYISKRPKVYYAKTS